MPAPGIPLIRPPKLPDSRNGITTVGGLDATLMAPIEHPGRYSLDFWSQCERVFKSSLLDIILLTSGAKAGKCSNRASWTSFCRLLEPRPESAQIEHPARHFVDFWNQGQKVLKSRLLELILSTFEAKARTQARSEISQRSGMTVNSIKMCFPNLS